MKYLWKLTPVHPRDLPGMEGWLEEMAAKGLYLDHCGTWSIFHWGEPRVMRFRIQPSRREFVLQEPPEELLELFADFGWQYERWITSSWALFSTQDPNAPEPNPDPQTLELSLQPFIRSSTRYFRFYLICTVFFLLLTVWVIPHMSPWAWQSGLHITLLVNHLFYLWAAWRAWEEFRVARVLRRCLESGNLLPPRPGPFPPWRSVFRLALDLLVLCGLLWNLWRTITAL